MKSKQISLFCLMVAANSGVAFADEGLEAYRQGNYSIAAEKLNTSKKLDPVMQYYLGRMYLYGYGQAKDNKIALQHLKNSAEKGLLSSQQMMARYELLQENNLEQALYWFKKAAASGDMSAQMYCAAAYLFGLGTKVNPDQAKKYYIVAAQHGNSIAQYELAISFLETKQLSNKKLGLIWLNKAVAQKNPDAQVMLAQLYLNGTLVEKNPEQAKNYLQQAINQGSISAIYTMGKLFEQEKNFVEAKNWYLQAEAKNYLPADIALSHLYSMDKSPLFDEHAAFLMMLKAAQSGSSDAQRELAAIYKNGRGVVASEQISAEWLKKSKSNIAPNQSKITKAVQWLTLGKADSFANTEYKLTGIFSPWSNASFLKENQENPAPKMTVFTHKELYNPKFTMLNPNDIPIGAYYNALVSSFKPTKHQIDFPKISKETAVLAAKTENSDSNVFALTNESPKSEDRITALNDRALLGDPSAQLELGQRYQTGDGVNASEDLAIKYYKLAAWQHDVNAAYQLASLYLTSPNLINKRKEGLDLMTDIAFRGLPQAQYVIGQINEYGLQDGSLKIPVNEDQALAMYKLSSTNNFGLAQYRLADLLVRQKAVDMSRDGLAQRYNLIKSLYAGAAASGVKDAALPLAFYNAMDPNPKMSEQAFLVAKQEAESGNHNAALLLALMYDRGLATKVDQDKAHEWYQKADMTPVSAFVLGTYMSQGHGMTKNVEQGKILLQKAADDGFMYANFNLSILKHDLKEDFIADLEKAMDLGHSLAGVLLADYYVSNDQNNANLQKSRSLYQRFATQGDQNSQLKLAHLYDLGLGGTTDWKEAAKWYQASAEQGNMVAQYLLGHLYQLGRIDSQPDLELAHKWYTASASNYIPAAVANGFLSDTFEDDYTNAFKSYEYAANKGDAVGQYDLGLMYEEGKGVPVDLVKAKELYSASAKQGYQPAILRLKN